jgi:hypothetical protein
MLTGTIEAAERAASVAIATSMSADELLVARRTLLFNPQRRKRLVVSTRPG